MAIFPENPENPRGPEIRTPLLPDKSRFRSISVCIRSTDFDEIFPNFRTDPTPKNRVLPIFAPGIAFWRQVFAIFGFPGNTKKPNLRGGVPREGKSPGYKNQPINTSIKNAHLSTSGAPRASRGPIWDRSLQRSQPNPPYSYKIAIL